MMLAARAEAGIAGPRQDAGTIARLIAASGPASRTPSATLVSRPLT